MPAPFVGSRVAVTVRKVQPMPSPKARNDPSSDHGRAMSGGVNAVDRAFRILACFREHRETLALRDIAAETGLYPSTVLRLTESLVRAGMMVRLADKNFELGAESMRLGSIYRNHFDFERHVRPVLEELVAETGESASFYRREGDSRVCLYRADSLLAIRDHIREGERLPLSQGAAGHVLTGFATTGSASGDWRSALPVVSLGERDAETAAAAVPVFSGGEGLVGALAVSGPLNRFSAEAVAAMAPKLIRSAARLTARLGGRQYAEP